MEYVIYKKILNALDSFDSGLFVIDLNSGLTEVIQDSQKMYGIVLENILKLSELENELNQELELNSIESKEKVENYCTTLLNKLDDAYTKILLAIEHGKFNNEVNIPEEFAKYYESDFQTPSYENFNEKDLLLLCTTSIKKLIDIVSDYKFPIESEETIRKTSLILYLHYSGLLEDMRAKLTKKIPNLSARRLGETVAKIIGSSKNFPSPIISGIGSLSSSNPYYKISKSMVEQTKQMLADDHFETAEIDKILFNWRGK